MLNSIICSNDESFAHNPPARGYLVLYRENQVNHCPGCGRTHWYVGRFSAECGFCGTALALAETGLHGTGTHRSSRRPFAIHADAA